MAKEQKEIIKKEYPEYTSSDFIQMEKDMEKYMVEKELPILKKIPRTSTGNIDYQAYKSAPKEMVKFVPVEGERQWYEDNGVFKPGKEIIILDIDLYDTMRNKLNKYNQWKGKKEYAIKKELESLSEMSESLDTF